MNVTEKTAGETARKRVIVAVCDVFDIRKTKEWYASRGYQPTSNWQYANRQKTIVRGLKVPLLPMPTFVMQPCRVLAGSMKDI